MKKVISIICITLLVALYSCDERDELRSDIDNLKERVANLEASIEQMNSDISNYQQMVEGKILVVGYSKDEQDNYTIELSNGETITIYSGKVDMNDMPLFSVNASGHWAYTINDMTTELLVNDKPVSAIPEAGTAGVTPKLKVDANGFWLVSIDNGSTWNKLGNNQIADGTQAVANASSLFSNVTIDETTGQITFTIRADNSQVKVPIYGKDFYLTIKYEGTATFGLGQKQEFVVEQANVETATIENQTWGVKLTENKLIVTAAPHITSADSTQKIMQRVCIALLPTLVASVIIFGINALILTAISVAACVFFEWGYCKLVVRENPTADFSAVVTGILLAFVCPVNMQIGRAHV